MRVFISWSGERSREIAEVLRDWSGIVVPDIEPFMSANDISPGSRWSREIDDALNSSDIGIICITPENKLSPWLHFEAGAIAKSVENSCVIPFLTDISETEIMQPFSHFQAKSSSKESDVLSVFSSIADKSDNPQISERFEERFDLSKEKYFSRIQSIAEKSSEVKDEARPIEDILEELLSRQTSVEYGMRELSENLKHASILASHNGEFYGGDVKKIIKSAQAARRNNAFTEELALAVGAQRLPLNAFSEHYMAENVKVSAENHKTKTSEVEDEE